MNSYKLIVKDIVSNELLLEVNYDIPDDDIDIQYFYEGLSKQVKVICESNNNLLCGAICATVIIGYDIIDRIERDYGELYFIYDKDPDKCKITRRDLLEGTEKQIDKYSLERYIKLWIDHPIKIYDLIINFLYVADTKKEGISGDKDTDESFINFLCDKTDDLYAIIQCYEQANNKCKGEK